MRIGWLGLGAMGGPMAACLARAGHQVHGYDIAPERAAALAADGVRPAASIAAAVADADLAAIMVANPDQLEQVLFGPDGAAAATPLANAAGRLYTRGHDLGLGRLDDAALIEVLRRPVSPPGGVSTDDGRS